MRNVLVDDPEPLFVHSKNEGIANLAERLERAESRKSGLLFVDIEERRTPIVGNRVELLPGKCCPKICSQRSRFQSASYRNRGIRFDGDTCFELKVRGNRRLHRRLQRKI